MDDEKPSGKETVEGIEIDYDHLDVAAIMTQVNRVAALNPIEPVETGPEESPVPTAEPPAASVPPAPAGRPPVPPAPGRKALLKAKFARAIRPFAPAIRLLGLPLHEDIQAAVRQLDATNRRLDEFEHGMQAQIDRRLDEMQARTDALFNDFGRKFDDFRDRLDLRLVDLDRSMEYIKLLHNLDHNLVVEITKLRVEFETLKSRARILEKDLDAQAQRERVLEKRLGS